MTKVNLYNSKGTKKESVALPKEIEGNDNPFLLAQSIRVYADNAHFGTSHAKTRAEVNATGKKVWKQKGTGNARHGSRRAPIFVGGGKAHGPKGIKRVLELPIRMRQIAIKAAINLKTKTGSLVFISGIESLKKTKEAYEMITSIFKSEFSKKKKGNILLVLSDKNGSLVNVFRNIKNVKSVLYKNLNAHTLITGGLSIFDNSIFEAIKSEKKSTKNTVVKKTVKTKK